VRTLKSVLIDRHIGALLVGFVLAQGVASLVGLFLVPIGNASLRWVTNPGFTTLPPLFPPGEMLIGVARTVAYVGVGLLILKWLYLTQPEPLEEPDTSESEGV